MADRLAADSPSHHRHALAHKSGGGGDENHHLGSEQLAPVDDMVMEYLLFRGFTKTFRSFSAERQHDRVKCFDVQKVMEQLFGYISELVLPELQEQQIDKLQLLKATCMKFVYMFRVQVPAEHTLNFVNLFAEHLKSTSIVNQSYAAACIDKFLTKQDKVTRKPVINKDNIGEGTVTQLL